MNISLHIMNVPLHNYINNILTDYKLNNPVDNILPLLLFIIMIKPIFIYLMIPLKQLCLASLFVIPLHLVII